MPNLGAVRAVQYAGYAAAAFLLVVFALLILSDGSGNSSATFGSGQTRARVLTVGGDRDYSNISEAIAEARGGDIVRVHGGVYRESVDTTLPLVIQAAGDGPVWIDGQCREEWGLRVSAGDGTVISGIGVRNTVGPGILIGSESHAPQHITVEDSTVRDFNCRDADAPQNAGVAVWQGRCCMQITGNTIVHRTTGEARGLADGIWFGNTEAAPDGGGHLVEGNSVTGGRNGIGSNSLAGPDGGFGRNSKIQDNVITGCSGAGVQIAGGTENVSVRRNEISACQEGIAFAPESTGTLRIQDNVMYGLTGSGDCLAPSGSATADVRLDGNVCAAQRESPPD